MMRVMAGLAAWAAGTVIAVSVAWFGANVVVRNAGVGPGMPIVNAAVPPAVAATPASPPPVPTPPAPAPSSAASTHPTRTTPSPSPTAPSRSPSPSSSASASPADVHAYVLSGGTVTLDVTPTSAQLVTAVPNIGDSVQTWSGTDWLRVDFSQGAQVSSLIASWYEHAPTITVTN